VKAADEKSKEMTSDSSVAEPVLEEKTVVEKVAVVEVVPASPVSSKPSVKETPAPATPVPVAAASPRVSSVPNTAGDVSQTITIPATATAMPSSMEVDGDATTQGEDQGITNVANEPSQETLEAQKDYVRGRLTQLKILFDTSFDLLLQLRSERSVEMSAFLSILWRCH